MKSEYTNEYPATRIRIFVKDTLFVDETAKLRTNN
jgi:hypothetical protein